MKKGFIILALIAFSSSSLFSQWTKVFSSNSDYIEDICFTNVNTGYAGTISSATYKTTNGGINWSKNSNSFMSSISSMCLRGTDSIWMVGNTSTKSEIRLTTDGFKTTTLKYSFTSDASSPDFVDIFTCNNKLWALCTKGTMYYSDNGEEWTMKKWDIPYSLSSIHFFDENNGLIVASYSKITIISTTDGGINWTEMPTNTTASLQTSFFTDSQNGWIAGSNGKVLKTTDGGVSWDEQVITTKHLKSIKFMNKNEGVVVGQSGVAYSTIDGGKTWEENYSNTTDELHCINLLKTKENTYKVFAAGGMNSTILYQQYSIITDVPTCSNEIADDLQISPNPASNFIKVSKNDLSGSIISISNSIGTEIRRINSNDFSGDNKVIINTEDFTPGMYFCTIKSGQFYKTKSFIISE